MTVNEFGDWIGKKRRTGQTSDYNNNFYYNLSPLSYFIYDKVLTFLRTELQKVEQFKDIASVIDIEQLRNEMTQVLNFMRQITEIDKRKEDQLRVQAKTLDDYENMIDANAKTLTEVKDSLKLYIKNTNFDDEFARAFESMKDVFFKEIESKLVANKQFSQAVLESLKKLTDDMSKVVVKHVEDGILETVKMGLLTQNEASNEILKIIFKKLEVNQNFTTKISEEVRKSLEADGVKKRLNEHLKKFEEYVNQQRPTYANVLETGNSDLDPKHKEVMKTMIDKAIQKFKDEILPDVKRNLDVESDEKICEEIVEKLKNEETFIGNMSAEVRKKLDADEDGVKKQFDKHVQKYEQHVKDYLVDASVLKSLVENPVSESLKKVIEEMIEAALVKFKNDFTPTVNLDEQSSTAIIQTIVKQIEDDGNVSKNVKEQLNVVGLKESFNTHLTSYNEYVDAEVKIREALVKSLEELSRKQDDLAKKWDDIIGEPEKTYDDLVTSFDGEKRRVQNNLLDFQSRLIVLEAKHGIEYKALEPVQPDSETT